MSSTTQFGSRDQLPALTSADALVSRITALRDQHGRRLEATELEDLYSQGYHEGARAACNILLVDLI